LKEKFPSRINITPKSPVSEKIIGKKRGCQIASYHGEETKSHIKEKK
jgi:hypothetical protein